MSDLRDRIAAAIRADLAEQLQAVGIQDATWAADVCDNTAHTVLALFTPEYRRLQDRWILRWNSDWAPHG